MSFVDATCVTYLHFDWCRIAVEGGSHWGAFSPQVTFCDLPTRMDFLHGQPDRVDVNSSTAGNPHDGSGPRVSGGA